MSIPILATKLFISQPIIKGVKRPRLIERLNEGLTRKLTLLSAPAGFGKTTLVGEWVSGIKTPVVWLSLDEEDKDPVRFLVYLIAALQKVEPNLAAGVLRTLQSTQAQNETILTSLLNEINTIPGDFVLILDDYHVLDSKEVDQVLAFLIDHQPPQMHLVINTREDPDLPLARLRVRDQMSELRAADLRFSHEETAGFLNQVMDLALSGDDITALETRTEGWIAGLQLAAISMRGHPDKAGFVKSFTGSHHFVLDYLVEEVLNQQSESIQSFLLSTSILDRLSASLCDTVLLNPSISGQATLEYLEHANLFIVPLDSNRRWYRYHHLFVDLLRQRLQQNPPQGITMDELHQRASQWYEDNSLELDAFHHAAAANDYARTERLIAGNGMPLQFRGAVIPVLNWLQAQPAAVLDSRPGLWVMYASALSMTGQLTGVEQKLQAAENALQGAELDDKTRNLIGHIAAIRALLAAAQNQVEIIIEQSQRALAYLHPANLSVRTATIWKMGIAYHLQGNRAAAGQAYREASAISQASGNTIIYLSATVNLGNIHELENQLNLADETYRHVILLAGDPPPALVCDAYLGLARISYEWNNLDAAQGLVEQALKLAPQMQITDRVAACQVLLARLKLARGDLPGADALLTQADQSIRQNNFVHILPELTTVQVLALLRQGKLDSAVQLLQSRALPLCQARVLLAQADPSAALAVLAPYRQQMETRDWQDEHLKVMVLQAVALFASGENDKAIQALENIQTLAEPQGFTRLFVDEGQPMAQLLSLAVERGRMPEYFARLLAACQADQTRSADRAKLPSGFLLVEPLSQRELEVLRLVALGLSNHEISARLFLSLNTIKGHNQKIFDKLQVQRRTEAVARARELGLI